MKPRIVIVGSSNTDLTIKTPRIPKPGETILGGDFSMAAGGKGANQAVAAAGAEVAFVARVGADIFGQQAWEGFQRDHINTKFLTEDPLAPSGVALIFVGEGGENSIAVASGANAQLSPIDVAAAQDAIQFANVLLVQLEVPLETVRRAVEIAATREIPTILNPAPAQQLDNDLLHLISIITPNETEAEQLTGIKICTDASIVEAARALLFSGVKTAIITLGHRGAYVRGPSCQEFVPSFKVPVIDTTAAGDVFNGALAVMIAERRPIKEAVRFANAAAALSVTKLGAQPSAPFRREIEELVSR
jgi:ribokinase